MFVAVWDSRGKEEESREKKEERVGYVEVLMYFRVSSEEEEGMGSRLKGSVIEDIDRLHS
jgi:hypothetical protein